MAEDWSGFGAIPFELEDLLLLLRLYRPGDLAFAGIHIETPTSSSRQYPYRVVSGLVGASTRQFEFLHEDCQPWEDFAIPLRASPQWSSTWFALSRRYFLYGGGKEFNPNFLDDLDRVMDYVIALEASLVPESDLVSRRLRERAVRLLELSGSRRSTVMTLLSQMYSIRSSLAHGSPLGSEQILLLKDKIQWLEFEKLVRDILSSALTQIPSVEASRRSYLTYLYDISDAERREQIIQIFGSVSSIDEQQTIVDIIKQKIRSRDRLNASLFRRIGRLWRKWIWKVRKLLRWDKKAK